MSEAEYIKYKTWLIDEVAQAFRIPASLLNVDCRYPSHRPEQRTSDCRALVVYKPKH